MAQKSTSTSKLKWLGRFWLGITTSIGTVVILGYLGLILLGIAWSNVDVGSSNLASTTLRSGSNDNIIAVIELSGIILSDELDQDPFSLSTGIIGADQTIDLLSELASNDNIKALVVNINSPGGSPAASEQIHHALSELEIPVVMYFTDTAASGGYYIATAGDVILANPVALTGSIGVIAQIPNLDGLYDLIGVDIETIKTGQFKDLGTSDRALTSAEREILAGVLDDTFEQFLTVIETGRPLSREQIESLADGRIYTARQAVDNQLIDATGYLDDAIDQAAQLAELTNPQVVEYKQTSFLDTLLGMSGVDLQRLLSRPLIDTPVPSQRLGVWYLMTL